MDICVHIFKIAIRGIMGVLKSIMPRFTNKPWHYGHGLLTNRGIMDFSTPIMPRFMNYTNKLWHYGFSAPIMPQFA